MKLIKRRGEEAVETCFGSLGLKSEVATQNSVIESGTQYISVDAGSTGVRTMILNKNPEEVESIEDLMANSTQLQFNSYYIEDDSTVTKYDFNKSDKIKDKLQMVIQNYYPDAFIPEVAIIRETLTKAISKQSNTIVASVSKVDQQQIYINIISAVALSLLNKEVETGIGFSSSIDVKLTISIPPEDAVSSDRSKIITERLKGRYAVTFPCLDHTVRFNVNEENIIINGEPYASAVYAQAFEKSLMDGITATFEVGGRSTGFIVDLGDRLSMASQCTLTIGGKSYLETITSMLNSREGTNLLTPVDTEVLKTGKLRQGAREIDISEIIGEANALFAKQLFNKYLIALDRIGQTASDVAKIILSGRIFSVDYSKYSLPQLSVKALFEQQIHAVSPNTIVEYIGTQHPIPVGLMVNWLNEL